MDSISVKIPVTIKAKLTEKLKKRIIEELTKTLTQLDLELQQIDIQEKRAVTEQGQNNLDTIRAIHQHFGMEKQKRLEYKAQAEKKLEETNKLAIGAEIIQGNLERVAELKIGDNMRELMNVEVLIEDDKIIAIRG